VQWPGEYAYAYQRMAAYMSPLASQAMDRYRLLTVKTLNKATQRKARFYNTEQRSSMRTTVKSRLKHIIPFRQAFRPTLIIIVTHDCDCPINASF